MDARAHPRAYLRSKRGVGVAHGEGAAHPMRTVVGVMRSDRDSEAAPESGVVERGLD